MTLRDAGAGLVGWWHGVNDPPVGASADVPHSPSGCILRITPAHGRFQGRVHTPSDLAEVQSNFTAEARERAFNSDFLQLPPALELYVRRDDSSSEPQYATRAVAVCPAHGGPAYLLGDEDDAADGEEEEGVETHLDSSDGLPESELNVHIIVDGDDSPSDVAAQLEAQLEALTSSPLLGAALLGSGASSAGDDDAVAAFSASLPARSADSAPPPAQDVILQEALTAWGELPMPEARPQRVPASLLRIGRHQFVFEYTAAPTPVLLNGVGALQDVPVARDVPLTGRQGTSALARRRRDAAASSPPSSPSGAVDDAHARKVAETWAKVAAEVAKMDVRGPQNRAALIAAVKAAAEETLAAQGLTPGDAGDDAAARTRGARVTVTVGGNRGRLAARQGGIGDTLQYWSGSAGRAAGLILPASATAAAPPPPHRVLHRTRFTRIDPRVASGAGPDPFSALYLGAFGPHGPEVLQLTRGRWGDDDEEDGFDSCGEECVTAVKLTGDRNVPAGRASFRARVGRRFRLPHHGVYPEELGVLARYKGQGRAAKPGFSEPQWVDGELLVFDGKGGALTGGAELGLVWAVPGERRFLILLSRLQLPA